MVHYIIVKWVQGVDKKRLAEKVRTLYADAVKIPGIQAVEIKENVTPRENRYDLMIALHMENDALSGWDNSDLHIQWKAEFGSAIEKNCIFDSEM